MSKECCMVFQALSDKTRLKILQLLKKQELCVSDICEFFNITQPSISHHLDMLKRAGLVSSEKRGREVFYTFNQDTIIECCESEMRLFDIDLRKC